MLDLSRVTLCTIATRDHYNVQIALNTAQLAARFANVVVFTDFVEGYFGYDVEKITPRDYKQWCVWRLTEFPKFRIKFSNFVLFIESDARIVKPDSWTKDFYEYDYIGAPWTDGEQGNGGFCLMSQKMLNEIEALNIPSTETACHPCDTKTCRVYRRYFEVRGIKYAPLKVAQQFSSEQGPYTDSFGVHSYRHCQDRIIEASQCR